MIEKKKKNSTKSCRERLEFGDRGSWRIGIKWDRFTDETAIGYSYTSPLNFHSLSSSLVSCPARGPPKVWLFVITQNATLVSTNLTRGINQFFFNGPNSSTSSNYRYLYIFLIIFSYFNTPCNEREFIIDLHPKDK